MFTCRSILAAALVLCASVSARAQESSDSVSTAGVAVASLIPASMIAGIIVLNQQAFWKYAEEVPFHISNDPPYAMHIDKFSHFYVSAVGSDIMHRAYAAAGLKDALWLGAALSLAAGTTIELEDARHGNDPQYGFSPGDLTGDILGSALPILKEYWPPARRFDVKLSVWPSDAYKAGAYKTLADDYESQYYWLSFDLHEVTPLPAWLNIALGFGCENLYREKYSVPAPGGPPYTDLYFGPDINLRGIPIEGKFWKTLTDVLSYVRIPLPALQFYPRAKV